MVRQWWEVFDVPAIIINSSAEIFDRFGCGWRWPFHHGRRFVRIGCNPVFRNCEPDEGRFLAEKLTFLLGNFKICLTQSFKDCIQSLYMALYCVSENNNIIQKDQWLLTLNAAEYKVG
jgi:hypothetical protein